MHNTESLVPILLSSREVFFFPAKQLHSDDGGERKEKLFALLRAGYGLERRPTRMQ